VVDFVDDGRAGPTGVSRVCRDRLQSASARNARGAFRCTRR